MIQTFIILLIAVLVRIVLNVLEPQYAVLTEVIPYVNWFIVAIAIIFLIFVIIKIFKMFK